MDIKYRILSSGDLDAMLAAIGNAIWIGTPEKMLDRFDGTFFEALKSRATDAMPGCNIFIRDAVYMRRLKRFHVLDYKYFSKMLQRLEQQPILFLLQTQERTPSADALALKEKETHGLPAYRESILWEEWVGTLGGMAVCQHGAQQLLHAIEKNVPVDVCYFPTAMLTVSEIEKEAYD